MMSIVETIAGHALRQPDKTAIITCSDSISYAVLWHRIVLFAQYLHEFGAAYGACILAEEAHSIDFCVVKFAAHLLGCVFVPVDKRLPAPKVLQIIEKTSASIYFGNKYTGGQSLENAMKAAETSQWPQSIPKFPSENDPSDLIFTTGTTGEAKGIVHTHRSQYATACNFINLLSMTADTVCAVTTPLSHLHGVRRMNGTLINGSTVILTGGAFPPIQLLRLVQANHAQIVSLVPASLSFLLKTAEYDFAKYFEKVEVIEFATSALSTEDVEKTLVLLPRVHIINTYGTTEAGIACSIDLSVHRNKRGCIGKPTKFAVVSLVDDTGKQIDGTGAENQGYISLSGPTVMSRYWDQEQSEARISDDFVVLTRDIAFKDDEGYFYYVCRDSDVINVGGTKIIPSDVERAALEYDSILECACVGKPDQTAGEIPVLCIALKPNFEYDESKLRLLLTRKLEPSYRPKSIVVFDSLPKASNGKLLRKQLKQLVKEKT